MAVLERAVRWNLDVDGDIYGDERERLRWYGGIAAAATLQWVAVPCAAAVLVWILGRPVVLPLLVVLVVMVLPMILSTLYVRQRRVDTDVRQWSAKRVLLTAGLVVPVIAFYSGARHAYDPGSYDWLFTAFGGVVGALLGMVVIATKTRQRRRAEASAVEDED